MAVMEPEVLMTTCNGCGATLSRATGFWSVLDDGNTDLCHECYQQHLRDELFTCPNCHRTSYNPNDKKHRYCGACKRFFP